MDISPADLQLVKDAINAIDWNIHLIQGAELAQIRTKYSDTEINYSRDRLINLVREKAKLHLTSKDGRPARQFFYKLQKHYLCKILLESTDDILSRNVCEKLFHLFNNTDLVGTLTAENLSALLICLKDYQGLYGFQVSAEKMDFVDSRVRSVCNSVLTLKKACSLSYQIANGDVWIDSQEFNRVGGLIKDKMRLFGGATFLAAMFSILKDHKKFDDYFKRYLFPIPTSQINDKKDATVPWGYLFNLAIRFPDNGDQSIVDRAELWREIITLGSALVSCLDVEPYSTWDTEFKAGSDAVKMMSDVSLLESNFRLPQIRYSDLMPLLKGCFSWVEKEQGQSFEVSYSDLNYFLNNLLKYLSHPDPIAIRIGELRLQMKRLSDEKFKFILDLFTHAVPPNQNFISPADHTDSDAFFKPMISASDSSVLIPCPPYSCYAAIEAVCTYYRQKIKRFDDRLGGQLEQFVHRRLSKFQVKIKHGKYKNSDGEAGEIDAAIEFDDLIGLIEIKKKSFTRRARSGHWDSVLVDIHKSLLDSQYQALGHEYSLTKDHRIAFEDGSSLEQKGRPAEKITLVLFDYGAIQDRTIVRQLLPMYMQCRFSSVDSKLNAQMLSLNGKCEDFNRRYSKYAALFDEQPNIPFFGSCFFSIPQFLVLLDGVKNISDLKKALWNTKFVTAKTLDWYYEHSYMSGLKNRKS